MATLKFKNGKAQIKDGKNVIATIYDRAVFFAGTKVNWNANFPFALSMNGGQAEVKSLGEAIKLFYSEL